MPLLRSWSRIRRRAKGESALRHEPVAARQVAGRHAEHAARDYALAVHHHQPVHRADELRLAVAPAHELRDGQLLDGCVEDIDEHRVE